MKKITLLLCSISFLSFVGNDEYIDNTIYFEGQVTYEIEYSPYDENISPLKLKELIGSTMVMTFKKGNYKKEYFSPDGSLVQQRNLNLKEERSYLRTTDSDTIYWIDITKNDTKTLFETLKDSTILGHPCKVIQTNSIVTGKNFGGKPFEVEGVTSYAKDLPVNPDWYTHYYEGNFNEIIEVAKGIAIVTIDKGIFWEQRMKLKSVVPRRVSNKEIRIEISKDRPLKQL